METFIEKSLKINRGSNFKSGALLALLTVFSYMQCMAESETFTKTKEELEHQTQMSYVYMVLGFVAMIGIAWYSVKKSSGTNQTHQHHPPASHHHHHHNVHDKRYGTNHAK